jgi:hypothetical protein
MGYHLEPSLTVANDSPHTLGTFEKRPHLGGQSFPSGILRTPTARRKGMSSEDHNFLDREKGQTKFQRVNA